MQIGNTVANTASTGDAPALPKPSLLARKDIRDEYQSVLPELNATINRCLRATYIVDVDFAQIFAHCVAANGAKDSIGSYAKSYLASFVEELRKYTEDGEYDPAIKTFESLVTERKITIAANDKITYAGCRIKEGVFEINYNSKQYGTNAYLAASEMAREIDEALYAASPYTLPLRAKRSIRDDWEAKKESVVAGIKEELLGGEITLLVDYEAIWKTLVDAKKCKGSIDLTQLAPSFGDYIYQYFNGFYWQVQRQFNKDDLMVEGFAEGVPTRVVLLEVVPTRPLVDGYYECKIEAGRVVLRTTPANWGTNSSYVAEGLSKLL